MGLIARVLAFALNSRDVPQVRVDPGAGANFTADYVGDDIHPLPDDYAILVDVTGSGRAVAVGFHDSVNPPAAARGERILRGRNSSTGASVVSIWLKNNGSVVIANSSGNITLKTNGEVDINGATITTAGDVKTLTGISLMNHVHTSAAPGSPTSVPVPGV